MRRLLIVAGVLVALAAVPASASAVATLAKVGDVWRYTGDATDNGVTIGLGSDGARPLVFLDETLANPPGCADFTFSSFFGGPERLGTKCPLAANDRVEALMGDGNDFASAAGSTGGFFCGFFFPCLSSLDKRFTADGGVGSDFLSGGSAPAAGQFSNELRGGDGDDTLIGGSDRDKLEGGSGRDVVSGGLGSDELFGGTGIDEASFAYATERVLVSFNEVADDGVQAPAEGDNVHNDIEDLRGGSGPDVLAGTDANNTLSGGGGADQLSGGGGFDTYYGEDGEDSVSARDGNVERVDCGEGADTATIDTADKRSGCESIAESEELQGDLDRDGFREPADCNDRNKDIKPGATDVPDNGVDENCDGADASNRDRDGDGFNPPVDCDDNNPAFKPGAREVFGNGTDEDCNGVADPLQTISSFVRGSFRDGRVTTIRRLQAASVKAGTLLRIICKGSGSGARRACRGKTKDVPVLRDQSAVDLRRALNLRRVPPRVTLEIFLLREDSVAKLYRLAFRRSKLPKLTIQCQRVGTAKFAACP